MFPPRVRSEGVELTVAWFWRRTGTADTDETGVFSDGVKDFPSS